MENNDQSRTLYIIQILTIVALVLLLIVQALPFFGIMPPGKQPQFQTFPKSNISPIQQQSRASANTLSALSIPFLVLK